MSNTRNALQEATRHVDESMGLRSVERATQLSPVSSAKDVGRMPLRSFGKVEVGRIAPDPDQPRVEFDDSDLYRLAESIRAHGQLHPIRVRWNEPTNQWVIITGERRRRATVAAGLPTIDCYFVEGEVSEAELREQQIVENLLRKDLSPIEEAKAYQGLMALNSWNGKQVAEALRVTPSRVSRALALLNLPESVQQQVEAGTLPKSSAYELSKLDDDRQQTTLANQALSHAAVVQQTKQRRGKKSSRTNSQLHQTFFAENDLRVTVSAKRKANYHEVEEALQDAIDEVRHRIKNNIQLN